MTMVDQRADVATAMADVTHEARGAVGTIRFAITALLGPDDDAELRLMLLGAADAEAQRLVADLSSLPALVAELSNNDRVEPVDIAAALRQAARDANALGVDARVVGRGPLMADARAATVVATLGALLRVAAARGLEECSARAIAGDVVVQFGGADMNSAVAGHLMAAIGERRDDCVVLRAAS